MTSLIARFLEVVYRAVGLRRKITIDLRRAELIRNTPLDQLRSPEFLERDLLPNLGFAGDFMYQYPQDLREFCGTGLHSWQSPEQFSKYLHFLSAFPIESYLEIGVRHGGTLVIMVEYLSRFHVLKRAVGVDVHPCPSLEQYRPHNAAVEFHQISSGSRRFRQLVASIEPLDLVLIDGCHLASQCRNDFESVREYSNIIAVHDIDSDPWKGVNKVWSDVCSVYGSQYAFYEFTDQRSHRVERAKHYFGIGVAVRKDYLLRVRPSLDPESGV